MDCSVRSRSLVAMIFHRLSPRAVSLALGRISSNKELCEVMATLRTTVIMKTDIQGSTVRFRELPDVDLDALLSEHRQFVSRLAAVRDGRVVKLEGDGF